MALKVKAQEKLQKIGKYCDSDSNGPGSHQLHGHVNGAAINQCVWWSFLF